MGYIIGKDKVTGKHIVKKVTEKPFKSMPNYFEGMELINAIGAFFNKEEDAKRILKIWILNNGNFYIK